MALRWDDIDFQTGKLHVRRSKGGTPSVHPIGGRELRALRRLQREGQPGRYVFVSEHGDFRVGVFHGDDSAMSSSPSIMAG